MEKLKQIKKEIQQLPKRGRVEVGHDLVSVKSDTVSLLEVLLILDSYAVEKRDSGPETED